MIGHVKHKHTFCIRQRNLNMQFQSSGSKNSFIDHVLAIGHADDEDVVQAVDTVDLRQQLIHHAVINISKEGA